ncbi:MAG: metal ABC transporter permease [Bacteroidota bacterium]
MSESFEIFSYTFFQNAIAAAVLSGLLAAMVGTYIVSRKIVFMGGGITHASFGGIGMAYYFGLNPFLGAAVFAVISATGIEWISRRGNVREDSAIAILWSLGMALGVIFVFMTPGYTPDLMSFLFGNILSVGHTEVVVLLVFCLAVGFLFWVFYRPLVSTAFDPEFAQIMGIRAEVFRYIMSVIMALAIVITSRTIGIILVLSLFTIPQITAMLFSRNFATIIPLSAFWGVLGSVLGLMVSYWMDIPSGAAIICLLTLQFLLVKLVVVIRQGLKRD